MYELNNLIYKLYDLNKKEIEIIERKGWLDVDFN